MSESAPSCAKSSIEFSATLLAWIYAIERHRAMKRALDVEILGQRFTISSEAEEGYMLRVAGYVDGKMQELMQTTKPVAKSNVAMLAALNIADELHRLKDSHEAVLNRLDQLLKRVSTTVSEED